MPGLNGTNRRSHSHRDRTASRRKRFLANGNRRDTSRRHPPSSSARLGSTPTPPHTSTTPLLSACFSNTSSPAPHASAALSLSCFMQKARLAFGRREAARRRRHPRPHRRAFDAYARFVLDETASQVTWTRWSARRLLRVGFDGISDRVDALPTKDPQKKGDRP